MRSRPNRSQSLDKNDLTVDENLTRRSPSVKREWLCQICQQRNQSPSQLCSQCGSTQINLYIPNNSPSNNKSSSSSSSHSN